jgi:hypothetical protein
MTCYALPTHHYSYGMKKYISRRRDSPIPPNRTGKRTRASEEENNSFIPCHSHSYFFCNNATISMCGVCGNMSTG